MPQLDGIRFFAFFLVFVHHLDSASFFFQPNSLPAKTLSFLNDFGWIGVDLFLVLSGFLITTLLLLEYENVGRISLRDFYIRRALRIWPLYYILLLIGFIILPAIPIFAASIGSPIHTMTIQNYLVSYLTFFGNLAVGHYGYPQTWTLSHLWTIGLEEQFYIVWPAFLIILLRFNRRSIIYVVLFLILILSIALRWHYYDNTQHPFIWVSTHTRQDSLVFGVFLAVFRMKYQTPSGGIIAIAKFVLGILLVVSVGFVTNITHQSIHVVWQYSAIAIGFTLIIDSCLATVNNPFKSFFSQKWLVWLGKLTYGLYMYHLLAIQFGQLIRLKLFQAFMVNQTERMIWMTDFIVSLMLTILVSAVSYNFIERYFLKLKGRFAHIESRSINSKAT